jgi:hypothetical protein
MLETIAILLIILWLFGFISLNFLGSFVEVLLIVAVVLLLARAVEG